MNVDVECGHLDVELDVDVVWMKRARHRCGRSTDPVTGARAGDYVSNRPVANRDGKAISFQTFPPERIF
jgi:hypothetical protein